MRSLLLPVLVVALCLFPPACGKPAARRPNVLLIVVDTLRADHVGCLGYSRAATPAIDSVAGRGVLFENAVTQAAFTLPSMATLFTSLNPIDHGLRRHPDARGRVDSLPAGIETLPVILKRHGYATGAVISNSLFQKRFGAGFERGFDFYDVGRRRRDAGPTTDLAISWLEENAGKGKPFFLWVHYIDPHWPYDPPADFKRPFAHGDGGQYERVLRRFLDAGLPREVINFTPPLDADGIAAGIAAYDDETAYADSQIGRLLDRLRKSGLDGNTLIALVSDHGESLGEHGLFFAHSFTLYDEIEKVLFLIRPPGGRPPVRVRKEVRLLDFTPTVLALLGFGAMKGAEGRDLSPLWTEGEDALPEAPAYAESEEWPERVPGGRYAAANGRRPLGNAGKWRMVRFEGYKLIWIPGTGWELYDLEADPRELHDLSATPPQAARPLARILEEFVEKPPSVSGKGGPSPSTPRPDLDEDARRELEKVLRSMGYG